MLEVTDHIIQKTMCFAVLTEIKQLIWSISSIQKNAVAAPCPGKQNKGWCKIFGIVLSTCGTLRCQETIFNSLHRHHREGNQTVTHLPQDKGKPLWWLVFRIQQRQAVLFGRAWRNKINTSTLLLTVKLWKSVLEWSHTTLLWNKGKFNPSYSVAWL